ncbi:MAG: glutaredoxin family protein [Acidobacteria bacterium]|nr:glutaredoxin family protein [Acidobacteriota bacterium]
MPPQVILYTRKACHLCHAAKEVLLRARHRADFALQEVDIDEDPDLRARYHEEVPVITINGKKAFKYHVDEQSFLKRLRGRA